MTKFHDSNTGEIQFAQESGWYIQWRSESADEGWFKAEVDEIKDLTINLSRSGDVAWFYCILNDINEWQGQPANWENTRWTGVLEKRDGRWVIMQQHFSFASE